MLRVKDKFLAQELWIRLEENEASFAELASVMERALNLLVRVFWVRYLLAQSTLPN